MAGIIGTLTYKPSETELVIENGYVHLGDFSGGPNKGNWVVQLLYYLSYADYQADATKFVNISNDPNAPKILEIPDSPSLSPVDAALAILQMYWPTGTVVN